MLRKPEMSEPMKTCVLQSQVGDPQKFEETWNVQIFRSIDSSSAAGLPHTQAALKMGLSAQKGKIVDFSIQACACCLTTCSVSLPACTGPCSVGSVSAPSDHTGTCLLLLPAECSAAACLNKSLSKTSEYACSAWSLSYTCYARLSGGTCLKC